ncbi:MAG: DUF1778 domain-containing protein [Puniceicoccaceae bacterium]|nr:MAG: DUF1778 domain-containing protein [Puniceicoccaceae bacterium]
MITATKELKTERLVARIAPAEKALIEKAAEIEGRKVAQGAPHQSVDIWGTFC